jgi:hypothetical protein
VGEELGLVAEGRKIVSALEVEELDRLNLEQALIDFEIANARVVDLTGRVTGLSSELLRLRTEVGDVRLQLAQARAEAEVLRAESAEIKRSLAYRAARKLGDGRAAMRRR